MKEITGDGLAIIETEFIGPDLDEDISVENLILGQPSGESPDSFRRWLEKRAAQS